MATNQAIAALLPPYSCDAQYLCYVLDHSQLRFARLAAQTTQANLSLAILENFEVVIPTSVKEQQRIAEILDTIDTTIQRTEALIAKLKAAKAGLLHDLLTRGLDENGSLQQYENQSALPPHWRVRPLIEVADIASGVTLGRKLHGSDTVELPYLRVANVQDGFLDLTEIKTVRIYKSEVPRYLLQVGDILLTEGGDFDKLGRGTVWNGSIPNCLHQNHIFRVRPNPRLLNSRFLAAIFASPYGKAYFLASAKQTTNLASINSTQLKAFPVPMPSLNEQERIAVLLDSYETRLKAEEAQLAKLHQLKRGLMEDLLTGRVRVPLAQPEAAQAEAVN